MRAHACLVVKGVYSSGSDASATATPTQSSDVVGSSSTLIGSLSLGGSFEESSGSFTWRPQLFVLVSSSGISASSSLFCGCVLELF